MTRRFCEDFVQRLNLHDAEEEEEPLRRRPSLSIEDREKIINLARKEMALANIREKYRFGLDLHAATAEPPFRPRFCQERNIDLEELVLAKRKILHIEEPRLFPSKTTLTPDEHQQLRDTMRKLVEAEEDAVDKLYEEEEEDQDNREILHASLRNFHATYRALAQLEADAYSVI